MKEYKTIISNEAPSCKDALWIKPESDSFVLYLLDGGMWKPLKLVDDNATPILNDDKAKTNYKVTDITALTSKQCDSLNVGDQVIKKTGNQKHLYTVTYKEEKQGLCLSYIDAENAETVAYDYNGTTKKWAWTDITITPLVNNG